MVPYLSLWPGPIFKLMLTRGEVWDMLADAIDHVTVPILSFRYLCRCCITGPGANMAQGQHGPGLTWPGAKMALGQHGLAQ